MNQLIIPPLKPKIIKQKNHWAIFEISPCYPGYGVTLGNALRRVLLSSLGGAAITAIKIAGVEHEFTTIPHVMEDVVEIMLNLKQLRLKLYSDGPVKLSLKANGEKEIKAKNIQTPSDVEIINKELPIATLTDKKANLEMEMWAEKGLGYVPADQQPGKSEIGIIALDAIFTPIRKVNFNIENIRVGKRTDFNRLFLEIETDGTMRPTEAFMEAAKLLVAHFKVLTKTRVVKTKKPKKIDEQAVEKAEKPKKIAKPDFKGTLVDELKISSKTIKVLRENRIKSVANLAKKSEAQLLKLFGLGEKGVKEIKRELGKLGIILKSNEEV